MGRSGGAKTLRRRASARAIRARSPSTVARPPEGAGVACEEGVISIHARASWLLAAVLLLSPAALVARGQAERDSGVVSGAVDYRTYCASCHGSLGRGDGPLARQLATRPSDLTTLSRRNGGRFPYERVYAAIDGRRPAKAHGAMPAWADAFGDARAGEQQAVKERIRQLTQFVGSLQRGDRGTNPGPR